MAYTPIRIGISSEGAYFEYSREFRLFQPLKSVKWKNVDPTLFYELKITSAFTFIIGKVPKQVHIDKALHRLLQGEFEKTKGIDKKRDGLRAIYT